MTPISPNKATAERRRTGGYSLLETMIALAIMSLGVAFIMPKAAAALDQVVVHTVQFDLQRQISALKRRAVLTNTALVVIGPGASAPAPVAPAATGDGAAAPEQETAELTMRAGWTYRLSAPLVIDTDAHCSPVNIDLANYKQQILHLQGQSNCVFVRSVAQR